MKNRIANFILLVLFAGAILYCISYPGTDGDEYAKEGQQRAVILAEETTETVSGEESAEDAQEEDPYEEDYLPVSVTAECDSVTREISLYVSEGVCYAFLPAYADLTKVSFVFGEGCEVRLSGRQITAGEILQQIEIGMEYELDITDQEQNALHYAMLFMQSQNMPAVFIDTQSGSMDYVDAVKGNEESGYFTCVTEDGGIDSESAMNRIRGRGNTSWGGIGRKNQYNVQLADAADVMHMGSAQNWIIQANKLDVSMMRNKLAYDFAKDLGVPYAVDSEFTDMYFNGRYMGTYLVIEKIETGANRIDIDAEEGYVIERDFREKDPNRSFGISYGTYAIRSPKDTTEEAHDYIADYVNRAAESITKAADSDEYLDYIDVNSFAKLFIMNEISNDPDGNALSTYFYKADRTDQTKLTAGPVWDFDIAFDNDERGDDILGSNYGEEWFQDLYRSEAFRAEVAGVLRDIMEEKYEKYSTQYFDDIKAYLEPSWRMNEIRWKEKRGYIASVYPDFDGTLGYLEYYFMTRLENLNQVFNGEEQFHKVEFAVGGLQFAHVYVRDGELIPAQTLQGITDYYGRAKWRLTNDQEIDPDTYRVFEDVRIKCRSIRNDEETDMEDDEDVSGATGTGDDQKGELAMQWISFIMLMVPGLIAVWISGNTRMKRENAFAIVLQYLCNSFVILLLAYGIFYVLYGSALLSFSDSYDETYQFSIYHINVTFKYLLLTGILAAGVGAAERIVGTALRKRQKRQGADVWTGLK